MSTVAQSSCDERNELEALVRDDPCPTCAGGQRLDGFWQAGGECMMCNGSGIRTPDAMVGSRQADEAEADKERRRTHFARGRR
jgi:hypothetical protein